MSHFKRGIETLIDLAKHHYTREACIRIVWDGGMEEEYAWKGSENGMGFKAREWYAFCHGRQLL